MRPSWFNQASVPSRKRGAVSANQRTMSEDAGRDAVRAFLGQAIDDAGLFPPAKLSMRDALAAHERALSGPHAWMLGRFVVSASGLGELTEALGGRSTPLRVSVVFDGALLEDYAGVAREIHSGSGRVAIEAVELKLTDLPGSDPAAKAAMLGQMERVGAFTTPLSTYVEIGIEDDAHLELNLQTFRESPAGGSRRYVKVRCGGLDASATPSTGQLAQFIARARDLGVPFKATAGLHHPVRHHNVQAGFPMHGFLNVIGAAILARTHAFDRAKLEAILADENATDFRLSVRAFEWRGAIVKAEEIAGARATTIHSFGSCSFDEPLADLLALGIVQT